MQKPSYKISIGSTATDLAEIPISGKLVFLFVRKSINVPADRFEIILGLSNEIKINKSDKVTIEIGYEDKLTKVFEGSIERTIPTITSTTIEGMSPFSNLINLRKDNSRMNQNSGNIVRYLAREAGVEVATVEDGINLPYYVIDSRKNAYDHCLGLAKRNGFDLYCDEEGKLVFKKFTKTKADHIFTYGSHILSIRVFSSEPLYKGVEVYGESPASSRGKDTWCWFIKDSGSTKGGKGDRDNSVLIQDPAIRTKDAADTYAQAKLVALKKASVFGSAIVPGNPEVRLGDAVEFKECPQAGLNQVFQVRRVRHVLNKKRGFITEIGFCATGG